MNNLPWDNNSWEVAAQIAARRHRQMAAAVSGTMAASEAPDTIRMEGSITAIPLETKSPELGAPELTSLPSPSAQLLMQTVIVPGQRTSEGKLIEAVTIPWFNIIALLKQDPNVAFQIAPEKWEEIIAGAYHRAGFEEVTLTPRSGDHGRDVIAIKRALGSVRIIDQVKAYKPPHLVTADDVRALMGALQGDGASKGFLTTTSDFAPKLRTDPLIIPFMPARLELVNGTTLLARLEELARKPPNGD